MVSAGPRPIKVPALTAAAVLAPNADERESLLVLRASTLLWGVLAIGVALAMIRVRNALDVWWEMAGIFSGGMFGLFLLGILSRVANPAAMTAVAIGIASILWMTISRWPSWPAAPRFVSPFHAFMIPVVGTLVVLLVGLVANKLLPASRPRVN